jgi:putative phosphoribosyl transferase
LLSYRDQKPIVLGIPRGGIIVAAEVAKTLTAELDIIVARKLGAPSFPEFAIGAIAPNDVTVLDHEAIKYLNLDKSDVAELIEQEQKEMARRIKLFRAKKSELNVTNRIVILIDDGLATGLTAIASVRSLKKLKAKKIILAIPVASADAVAALRQEADQVVCLFTPSDFEAVGSWYQEFEQTTDQEVIAALANFAEH